MSLPEAKFTITAEDQTQRAFNSVKNGLGDLANKFSGIKTLLLEVAGITGFGALVQNSIDAGAEISKLSDRLGASTEALSQYRHVAEMSHIPFEVLTKSWQMMEKNISAAAQGTGPAKKGLDELHLSAQNLNQLKPDQQFEILADALSKVPNPADRVRLAFEIMGRSGVQMLQAMQGGSEKIRELRDEADRLGLTLHQAVADKMLAASEAMKEIKEAALGLGNTLAVQLAPAIVKVAEFIEKCVEWVARYSDALLTLTEIVAVGKVLQVGLSTLPLAINALTAAFQLSTKAVATFLIAFQVSPLAAFNTALFGTSAAATAASGALGTLKVAAGTLFAAFAGWEIGTWLYNNFAEARVAGLAFVGAILKGWEDLKYGAQVAWSAIASGWDVAVQKMKNAFGGFLQFVASGLSKVPGLSGQGDSLSQYGESLKTDQTAVDDFKKHLDDLTASHQDAIKAIDTNITELVAYQLNIGNAKKVTEDHKKTLTDYSDVTETSAQALKSYKTAQKDSNDLMSEGKKLTEEMRTPQEIYADHIKEINQLLQAGAINQDTYNRALKKYQDDLDSASGMSDAFDSQQKAADNNVKKISDIFRNGLFAFLQDGFKGMVKSFENALSAMAADAAANEIGQMLFGSSSGSKGGGILDQILGNGFGTLFGFSSFGGFKASGGPVLAGQGYVVGEQGPELFVPRQSGAIMPNSTSTSSGQITINNYIQSQDVDSFRRSEGNLTAKMKMQLDMAAKRNL